MISRREVVTAGVLGTLSNAAMAAPEAAQSQSAARAILAMQAQLGEIQKVLSTINGTLSIAGFVGPGLSDGYVGDIRDKFTIHLALVGQVSGFHGDRHLPVLRRLRLAHSA